MIDATKPAKQATIAALLGLSLTTVRAIESRGIASRAMSLQDWLRAYCDHLREQAAGRAADGDLDLATERARLASEQADRLSMQNAITRRGLIPAAEMSQAVTTAFAAIAQGMRSLPDLIERRCGAAPDVVEAIERVIDSEMASLADRLGSLSGPQPGCVE